MPRILGIDPGSRILGYGIIDLIDGEEHYVASGCVRFDVNLSFIERLGQIFPALQSIIVKYQPSDAAIEDVFFAKNAASTIKLAQARGAAVASILEKNILITEYNPRAIKLALVGKGSANKEQVSFMVQHRLKLAQAPQVDAGDALAVALCHLQHMLLKVEQQ